MNNAYFFSLLILFNLLLSCRPSTNTKVENLENKQEVKDTISLVHIESKLDSLSKRNITEVNYLPLPFGDSSILLFDRLPYNILIIQEEQNSQLIDNIISFNRYYDFGMNTLIMNNEIVSTFDSSWIPALAYYDVEINSPTLAIENDSVAILKKIALPNQTLYLVYVGVIRSNSNKRSPSRTYNLYSYNSDNNQVISSMNIYYAAHLAYNYDKVEYKNFTTGYVNKFFYISKTGIISLYYFDYIYAGEGEEYKYLRKEDWKVKANGKFVRYYEKEGSFKNEEEQGIVKNSLREGKWIEKKPNALVNKPTYLESYFKEGEPINEWKFYKADYDTLVYKDGFYTREKYIFKKKGKLLYTELYENGELIERQFIE